MALAAATSCSARPAQCGGTGSLIRDRFNFELADDHTVTAEGGRSDLQQKKPPNHSSDSLISSPMELRHSSLPTSPAAEHIVCAACKNKDSRWPGMLSRGDATPSDRSPCPSPRSTPTSPNTSVLGKRGTFANWIVGRSNHPRFVPQPRHCLTLSSSDRLSVLLG